VLDELRGNGSCDGPGQPSCTSLCVCEIAKAAGDDLEACLDPYAGAGDGWCYIAPGQGFGAADAVANCPSDARQTLNLAGQASPNGAELAVLACAGSSAPAAPSPLGSVCLPSLEREPNFHGFSLSEVNVIEQATCESGLCLVAHFQGRVSCPYGQPQEDPSHCFLPGSDANVSVGVPSQLVARPPSIASICSCRCAGPGPGPFCGCNVDQECAELIADLGLPESQAWAGSYCVPRGSLDDWSDAGGGVTCDPDTASCGDARPY
jgi:hypothetical protein